MNNEGWNALNTKILKSHRVISITIPTLITIFGFIINSIVAENVQLKKEVAEKQVTIETIDEELTRLKASFLTLNYSIEQFPFPMWIKSTGTYTKPGIMLYLNPAYEEYYLEPIGKTRLDYIGKTDAEFWGNPLGTMYWSNDMKVIYSKEMFDNKTNHPLIKGDSIRVIKYLSEPINIEIVTTVVGMVIPNKKTHYD